MISWCRPDRSCQQGTQTIRIKHVFFCAHTKKNSVWGNRTAPVLKSDSPTRSSHQQPDHFRSTRTTFYDFLCQGKKNSRGFLRLIWWADHGKHIPNPRWQKSAPLYLYPLCFKRWRAQPISRDHLLSQMTTCNTTISHSELKTVIRLSALKTSNPSPLNLLKLPPNLKSCVTFFQTHFK